MDSWFQPDEVRKCLGTAIGDCFLQHLEAASAVSPELISELEQAVTCHLDDVRGALSDNEFLDLELAQTIALACLQLLKIAQQLDEQAQAAVVAAVRYFTVEPDAQSDFHSVIGFEDDARVINYVIGLTEADIDPIHLEE